MHAWALRELLRSLQCFPTGWKMKDMSKKWYGKVAKCIFNIVVARQCLFFYLMYRYAVLKFFVSGQIYNVFLWSLRLLWQLRPFFGIYVHTMESWFIKLTMWMNNKSNYVICCLTLRYWHEKQREECHVFCNTKEHICGQTIWTELVEKTSRKWCFEFLGTWERKKDKKKVDQNNVYKEFTVSAPMDWTRWLIVEAKRCFCFGNSAMPSMYCFLSSALVLHYINIFISLTFFLLT